MIYIIQFNNTEYPDLHYIIICENVLFISLYILVFINSMKEEVLQKGIGFQKKKNSTKENGYI